METNQLKKARLSVDCSLEERRSLRILAAKADKTIPQYIRELILREIQLQGIENLNGEKIPARNA